MKNFTHKFIGLLGLVFAMSFFVKAQVITPDHFLPENIYNVAGVSNNMTIGINTSLLNSPFGTCEIYTCDEVYGSIALDSYSADPAFLNEGLIGAFYDINGDGTLECVGIDFMLIDGFYPLSIFGDDSTTPEIDGLPSGAIPTFAVLHENNVIIVELTTPFPGYSSNGIWVIDEVVLLDQSGNSISGCTDQSSCEYNPEMVVDDGSCVNYPLENFDCSGNCINDADGDEICDEYEISGCMDANFVEYNPFVTDAAENTCLTTWQEGYSSQVGEIFDLQNLNDVLGNELENVSYQLDTLTETYQTLLETPQCEEIIIDIQEGWNIFGYTSSQVLDIGDVMAEFSEYIYIIKDYNGAQYWGGDVNWNGIGDFTPGQGYQIKAFEPFSISFEN